MAPTDFLNWSFPLFRIFRIPVRMHWLMALMIGVYLTKGAARDGWWGLEWMGVTMTILIISILFHELAHCWMAIRLGGSAEKILLWPLGGLAFVDYDHGPKETIQVAGIGPFSSLLLCALCFGALPLSGAAWDWNLLLPFDDWWPVGLSRVQVFVLHAARLNGLLGLFNLCVPAYPLDGGQVLFGFLTLKYGRLRAAQTITVIAFPIGAALAILGFAQHELLLGFIGISVIFEAMQLRSLIRMGELEAHPGYRGSSRTFDYMPERPKRKGFFERWRERRAQRAAERETAKENELRAEVDAVLEKVSREGIGSLSAAEKKILDDASRRGRGE
jgi:Zn-dependent protease